MRFVFASLFVLWNEKLTPFSNVYFFVFTVVQRIIMGYSRTPSIQQYKSFSQKMKDETDIDGIKVIYFVEIRML